MALSQFKTLSEGKKGKMVHTPFSLFLVPIPSLLLDQDITELESCFGTIYKSLPLMEIITEERMWA